MNSQLRDCFNNVRDSQVAALAHYQIWFTLRGNGKAIDTHLDDMNDYRYVDFFHAANSGNYKLMFIEIAALFDSDANTNNIRTLKDQMRNNGLSALADKFTNQLSTYSPLVSNIKAIRGKVIAHKEAHVDPGQLYAKHGITPDDIRDLLFKTGELLQELESVLNNNSSCSSVAPTDRWERATFNLLDALKTERCS